MLVFCCVQCSVSEQVLGFSQVLSSTQMHSKNNQLKCGAKAFTYTPKRKTLHQLTSFFSEQKHSPKNGVECISLKGWNGCKFYTQKTCLLLSTALPPGTAINRCFECGDNEAATIEWETGKSETMQSPGNKHFAMESIRKAGLVCSLKHDSLSSFLSSEQPPPTVEKSANVDPDTHLCAHI